MVKTVQKEHILRIEKELFSHLMSCIGYRYKLELRVVLKLKLPEKSHLTAMFICVSKHH